MGHIRGLSGAWVNGPPRASGKPVKQYDADEPKPTDSTAQNSAPPEVPLHPPELGSIFWTARPRATVTAADKLYLNASKSPNRNRKRRPWVVVEVVSDDQVIMMSSTTQIQRGWAAISPAAERFFLPIAPTPGRPGRPVLELQQDYGGRFTGISLLYIGMEVLVECTALEGQMCMGQLAPSAIGIISFERKKLKAERLAELPPPVPPSLPPPVLADPGPPAACPWAPCRPRTLRVFRPHPTLYIPPGLSNFYPKSHVSSVAEIMQTPLLATSLQTPPLTASIGTLPFTPGLETPPLTASFGTPLASGFSTPCTPGSFYRPPMLANHPLKPALGGPPLKPMLATPPLSPVSPLSLIHPVEPIQFPGDGGPQGISAEPDPPLAAEERMEVGDEGASLR